MTLQLQALNNIKYRFPFYYILPEAGMLIIHHKNERQGH